MFQRFRNQTNPQARHLPVRLLAAMAIAATAVVVAAAPNAHAMTPAVGQADDTSGVYLYSAGTDTQGFVNPPPNPCAGEASFDPSVAAVETAVNAGAFTLIGDSAAEIRSFNLGDDGERVGGTADTLTADVVLGLSDIDDYGLIPNATGSSDDVSNFDAQTGGSIVLEPMWEGQSAVIVADGVTSTGSLGTVSSQPYGNLDGAEIFIFEDAETSGMTIVLTDTSDQTAVISIADYQRNPDTFGAADDTAIAIDLDLLPGQLGPVKLIQIIDDNIAVDPNVDSCPGGTQIDTSLELDAVAVRTDTIRVPAECLGLPVTVDLGAGDQPTSGPDVILGTEGRDVIRGLGGNDRICALGGNDVILGGSGNDVVSGGAGADLILGNDGNDTLIGGVGDDKLSGGTGSDTLVALEGNDSLWGGPGNDELHGHNGDDELSGGLGDDNLFGGNGDDTLLGSGGADLILGNDGDDVLFGGHGADQMEGGMGADQLAGNKGDDTVDGQLGIDGCQGGAGIDSVSNCELPFSLPA